MDKSSSTKSTQTQLLISSTPVAVLVVLTCIGSIYITTQHQLPIYSSLTYLQQHPLLVLNLIILLILISSRCFARYKNLTHNQDDEDPDHDPVMFLPCDPPQRIIKVSSQELETAAINPEKQEKLKSTPKKKIGKGEEHNVKLLRESKSDEEKENHMEPAELLRNPKKDDEVMSTTKLRKNVSLTKEEVNRRVEAFIRKFNDDNYSL